MIQENLLGLKDMNFPIVQVQLIFQNNDTEMHHCKILDS